jgi:hypothetical protein
MRNGLEIVQQQRWTRFLSTAVPHETVPNLCLGWANIYAFIADLIEIGVQNFVVSYILQNVKEKQISLW